MSENALPKGYEPQDVESRWRSHWEENKVFTPDPQADGEPFSIVIPPPNVTGALHMGHALNLTLQDILCRYQRQRGKNVLWVPGTDHAGIATQNVVERQLAKEGKGRHDLGREKFIERVWEWREDYGNRILNQVRKMGASVDWTRERFTMDEGLSRAVRKVFVELYRQGLIYKGDYIINWCPRCHTALADDEVDHSPEKGALHYIKYPLEDGSGYLTVATTRPETMLADTAVAVNPEDERFAHLIGQHVVLPLVNRKLRIIGDKYVEVEFGTGCLKVTPAHDHNDWELGRKHGLEIINILNDDGTLNELAGANYAGLTCPEARVKVLAALREGGFLDRIEEHDHNVGHCYRCKTVVEPYVSTQWFVAMTRLAPRAKAAVPELTQIFPETWIKTYNHWLDNIRDWCISRQIWWGHRIPAWTCADCGELIVDNEAPEACSCGSTRLTQDEDVLDTWFSSALWPFSTMGWPEKTQELARYYPTSVLVTGFDILFFWVARMMMMGLQFMDEVPFKHVYIHALVRDEHGKKMSKSTGNVIDPVEMIDKYGCDSLRFTLTSFAAMGRDIKLSEARIEGYRHFCNKIWNAARFALMNLPETAPEPVDLSKVALHHKWILSRLEGLKQSTAAATEGYQFNEVAQNHYKFIWNEFCDWYLELIKPDMRAGGEREKEARFVLWTVLQEMMVLLHPVMPFITAEVWAVLPGIENRDIATMPFPAMRPECADASAEASMEMVQNVIVAVRTIKAELNISPSARMDMLIRTASDEAARLFDANTELMQFLARIGSVTLGGDVQAPKASASAVVAGNEIILPLSGHVNFEDEVARLEKEIGKVEKDLKQVTGKLRNESFVAKAPAEIVQKEKDRATELEATMETLLKLQKRFRDAMDA
ncbi:valine--tRNA ligase [Desulfovibrio psychrotolerans]|uniref:Valine--tRNA ligase n=1 Tax=Desulfovibrio psychrotolerans TaxID=415242 RepID=A0A7J0BQJ1_9BACT|nr:valine--tRNA ligase [Desulfovibrio psychrotolerans]GFM35986.1 valine--tRNA ligase [Desulfovibrio psychrotolerans]